ncbi:MAG: signal peptidase II [Gaiellaceae bacterium]
MHYHDRPAGFLAAPLLLLVLEAAAVVLTRSRSLAAVCGLLVGGAAGNLLSLALWPLHDGVPDPFAIRRGEMVAYFNLADVFLAGSVLALLPVTVVFALRNRERLRQPVFTRSRRSQTEA